MNQANINKPTYKEGVTGNYERKRKSKSGPGKTFYNKLKKIK